MLRTRLVSFVTAVALPVPLALADIGPPPPRPPAPAGPAEAVIRGVTVVQGYGYWRGRRWLTYLKSCAPAQAACRNPVLANARSCLITGIDGQVITGGDIAGLIVAEKTALGRPIRLQLESCGTLTELELTP